MKQMAQGCGVVGAVVLTLGALWVAGSVTLAAVLDTDSGLVMLVSFPLPAVLSILAALCVANRH